MSSHFFEIHRRGLENAAQQIKLDKVFSLQKFKNVYEATLSSLIILSSGTVLAFTLSAMSGLLSSLLALVAGAIIVANIFELLPQNISQQHATNLAILAFSSALLVNILPYLAIIASVGFAIYKCQDLEKPMLHQAEENNPFAFMNNFLK